MKHPGPPERHRRTPSVWLALSTCCALSACAGLTGAERAHTPGAPRSTAGAPAPAAPAWDGVAFRGGVVSVSHPLAAQAGAEVLARGGNAIDAAAAIQFMLNVVEPQFSGIGGGGFMMVHLARERRTVALDAREAAPAAASPEQFRFGRVAPPELFGFASTSGVSVGVPGTLAALDHALKRWGSLGLADVAAPAIRVAEQGFAINRFLAANIANDGGRTSLQPETAALYRPGGVPLKEGDLLVQPELAKTLRLIAQHGSEVFYRGEIARAIVAAQGRSRTPVAAEGAGRMTLHDLAGYRVREREPLAVDYRGYTVASMPPPSSGGLTVGQMLLMLQRFPLGDAAQGYGFGGPATLHAMTEAMRLAFADRAVWMGDADFVPVPKTGLLHPDYVAERSALIRPGARMAEARAGDPRALDSHTRLAARAVVSASNPALNDDADRHSHTSHFSVVDRWGNVVSYTTTIEATWGTGILVPGYGFLLNNELTDFNLLPSADPASGNPGANDVAPGKRPRSSMAPTLVFKDGRPILAYGSPGGATIINSVLNVTLNLIDHGMGIQRAIDAPRLSVTSAAGTISCEGPETFHQPRFSVATQDALRALGHIGLGAAGSDGCNAAIGSVQGVVIDLATGRRYGGADLRREGRVIGQ